MAEERPWQVREAMATVRSPWLTLIGERLEDPQGQIHDYWRVEKADSVIILPLHRGEILLPPRQYRPGVGAYTWDFPGGRLPAGWEPEAIAPVILQRELGVQGEADLATLTPLNPEGWLINSAFSNQRLYGFIAHLNADAVIAAATSGGRYPFTPSGIAQLSQQLTCLQCRAVLLEYCLAQAPDLLW
ncbi:MAG: NUDIX hydrolase [Spirulina sp. DLM2.Bin59]|nr:MAG: NUDIX hydrolase [Spirulina sp. DLM2.Bin59]